MAPLPLEEVEYHNGIEVHSIAQSDGATLTGDSEQDAPYNVEESSVRHSQDQKPPELIAEIALGEHLSIKKIQEIEGYDPSTRSPVENVADLEKGGLDVPTAIRPDTHEQETTLQDFPDGGEGWFVVLGCFLIATFNQGWPLCWGVFQAYYKANMFPNVSDTTLSFLGSIQNGGMPIVAFVVGKTADRYGFRYFFVAASLLQTVSFITTAFSTKLWHFYITQGVIAALANGLTFPLIMAIPSQWFKKKRAFATGIVVAGPAIGGATHSLILRRLLTSLGLKKSMLAYAGIQIFVCLIGFCLIKTRGSARRVKEIVWFDTTLYSMPIFWSVSLSILVCVFGFMPPIIFATTYAVDKIPDISPQVSVVPIALINYSIAMGRIVIGFIADRIGVMNAYLLAVTISGLGQLLIWNFANSLALIFVYTIVVGWFAGCFMSLLPPVAAQLFGSSKLATLSGMLILFNIPGNMAGPPLVGSILDASGHNWHAAITFSGGCQILAALIMLYARFKSQSKILAKF